MLQDTDFLDFLPKYRLLFFVLFGPLLFAHHHLPSSIEAALGQLQIVLLDQCEKESELKKTEDMWMCNLGTLFVGLNSHNEVISNKRRNFGMA